MAMKKAAPKKTEPKPPTPRQNAMSSTKSVAKKANPAAAMGRQAAAKSTKETSAKIRERANVKSGAGYLKSTGDSLKDPKFLSQRNDLSSVGKAKFDAYGNVSFTGGRISQRLKDQEKRKKK